MTFPTAPGIGLFPLQAIRRNPQPGGLPGGPVGFTLPLPRHVQLFRQPMVFHWITGDQNNVMLPFPVEIGM